MFIFQPWCSNNIICNIPDSLNKKERVAFLRPLGGRMRGKVLHAGFFESGLRSHQLVYCINFNAVLFLARSVFAVRTTLANPKSLFGADNVVGFVFVVHSSLSLFILHRMQNSGQPKLVLYVSGKSLHGCSFPYYMFFTIQTLANNRIPAHLRQISHYPIPLMRPSSGHYKTLRKSLFAGLESYRISYRMIQG